MKKGYWLAAAFTLAFVGFGLTAFQKTLTPYLSFDEAKKSRGVVQVMGALDKQSDRYDAESEELGFDLVDAERPPHARRVPRRAARKLQGRDLDRRDRPLPRGPHRGREAARQVPLQVPGSGGREGLRVASPPRGKTS